MHAESSVEGFSDRLSRGASEVAPYLLGMSLCVRTDMGIVLRRRVIEVEAYDGFDDKASHAHKGRTVRNSVMFGPAGHWYVYLCYGVHWMLNLVTAPEGYPSAVLIRGVDEFRGPGRLTRGLGIDRSHNGTACSPDAHIWLEPGEAGDAIQMESAPRIGVDYAGPEWRAKPWRWYIPEK
ncbi:MAG: DNA-3-methyladenine glycosylase [Opitutales bacterium]|nr:DNA-3-methyladenine glycosylase [Opitutales bacterium]